MTTTPLKRRTLAEQMADALQESILRGDWPAGAALPTEPELAAEFGVSRAVVRDATRLLIARGLVDAQHGRGVFVTGSPVAAFGEALRLALRRAGATVWDVERFEQMALPEVYAEAARRATDDDLAAIRRHADAYHAAFDATTRAAWGGGELPAAEAERVLDAYRAAQRAVFAATHNALWTLLAEPLLALRMPRSWESGAMTADEFIAHERRVLEEALAPVLARDPDAARAAVASSVQLPPEAVAAMRATPIGEVARIPVGLPGRG